MKNYYRIMLGQKSAYAEEAYKGNFIAAGFIKDRDITHHLSDNWRDFNKEFIPLFLEQNPEREYGYNNLLRRAQILTI
jgi:restriction system protein